MLSAMGIQQIEEIYPLSYTTIRSSHNIVVVGAKGITRRKIRKDKIWGIFYLLFFS
jgi:hypothetical protein